MNEQVANSALFENYLVEAERLTASDLKEVREYAVTTGERFIATLYRRDLIPADELTALLAGFYQLPLVNNDEWPSEPVLGQMLAHSFLRKSAILPLRASATTLVLAVADPQDSRSLEAVHLATGLNIECRIASVANIENTIQRQISDDFSPRESVAEQSEQNQDYDVDQIKDLALGAPVIEFVNQLLLDAVHARATDLHLESLPMGGLAIRMRVDGMLRPVSPPSREMAPAIISRIKILSNLDIAERRLPQDGRAVLKLDNRQLDLRVATVPVINGEAIAIRLLDNIQRVLELSKLGFGQKEEVLLKNHLNAPYGLIVVTGPTGSGKTTTLAAALSVLNQPHRKILTIEDPVEYQIKGINQTQVKPEIGLTFATVLRSFLRHDPDVIMVGEMRDGETARIGVNAALTGHIVLTTLHTNTAAGTIPRLMDMGVDSFLIASSLRCIIGQRLVRLLCTNCRETYQDKLDFAPDVLARAGFNPGETMNLWRAKGCERCYHTGYAGRIAIAEVLDVNESLRDHIQPGISANEINKVALAAGMTSMLTDGLNKCRAGLTTIDEVRRVAFQI